MIIARDRYLDDTSNLHVTLSLATRTGVMHSLLSNIPDTTRDAVSDILVDALNRVEQHLKVHVARPTTHP